MLSTWHISVYEYHIVAWFLCSLFTITFKWNKDNIFSRFLMHITKKTFMFECLCLNPLLLYTFHRFVYKSDSWGRYCNTKSMPKQFYVSWKLHFTLSIMSHPIIWIQISAYLLNETVVQFHKWHNNTWGSRSKCPVYSNKKHRQNPDMCRVCSLCIYTMDSKTVRSKSSLATTNSHLRCDKS